MAPRVAWPWGIQIGPFGIHETYLSHINFHLINKSHAAFPFSCIPRKGQPTVDPKTEWHQGSCDAGAFKLVHLQSTKPIFAYNISTLLTGCIQHFHFHACRETIATARALRRTEQPLPFSLVTNACERESQSISESESESKWNIRHGVNRVNSHSEILVLSLTCTGCVQKISKK